MTGSDDPKGGLMSSFRKMFGVRETEDTSEDDLDELRLEAPVAPRDNPGASDDDALVLGPAMQAQAADSATDDDDELILLGAEQAVPDPSTSAPSIEGAVVSRSATTYEAAEMPDADADFDDQPDAQERSDGPSPAEIADAEDEALITAVIGMIGDSDEEEEAEDDLDGEADDETLEPSSAIGGDSESIRAFLADVNAGVEDKAESLTEEAAEDAGAGLHSASAALAALRGEAGETTPAADETGQDDAAGDDAADNDVVRGLRDALSDADDGKAPNAEDGEDDGAQEGADLAYPSDEFIDAGDEAEDGWDDRLEAVLEGAAPSEEHTPAEDDAEGSAAGDDPETAETADMPSADDNDDGRSIGLAGGEEAEDAPEEALGDDPPDDDGEVTIETETSIDPVAEALDVRSIEAEDFDSNAPDEGDEADDDDDADSHDESDNDNDVEDADDAEGGVDVAETPEDEEDVAAASVEPSEEEPSDNDAADNDGADDDGAGDETASDEAAAEARMTDDVAASAGNDGDPTSDNCVEDAAAAPPAMDEAAIEETVRRVIREELHGEIGQNLSRNIEIMIRDEIEAALARRR